MIFHRSTFSDIQKYYPDNIIKFQETGDRLWQIVSMRPDELKCIDADGFEIFIDLNEPYEVDYPLPGRVVYQDGQYACMLSRKPAKQYNRGIHNSNTSLTYLTAGGLWKTSNFTLQKLQQFVDKPAYQDVSTIDWESGYLSWALDKHFAVCQDGTLMCLFKSIGVVDYKTKTVKLKFKLFKQEVASLFNNWTIV